MPTPTSLPPRNQHPLPPDGSFQGARLPAALAPEYVRVDEKTPADHLEFARRLAVHLNYFNRRNELAGDWSSFYQGKAAVEMARLLAWPISRLGQRLAEYRELIEDHQNTVPRSQLLHGLFNLLTSAVINLDGLITNLPPDSPLRDKAEALVKLQLGPAFERWLAYYQVAEDKYSDNWEPDQVPAYLFDAYAAGGKLVSTAEVISGEVLLHERWTNGDNWADYIDRIGEDGTVFETGDLGASPDTEILHAVGHTYFHGVYEGFVSSALHLRTGAQKAWDLLQKDPGHDPQIALLLTFLEVRQQQQAMLNGLTDLHLDFYYRRVLRTNPADARPPRALLHLEPRKNVPADHLPAGTVFRGGKDPLNATPRHFVSQEALTLSPAKIVEKRAIFKVAADPDTYNFPGENRTVFDQVDSGRLYAANTVDSADGAGETDLPETASGWHPFGYRSPDNGRLKAGMVPARVGMAVASHYLFLQEGTRTITFVFISKQGKVLNGQTLEVFLTTEEGWMRKRAIVEGKTLEIKLEPADPAILPYNEEVHQLGVTTKLPMARFELTHAVGDFNFNRFRNVQIQRIDIRLNVIGLRQMTLSGSAGVVDGSEPFYPFGPAPRRGAVMHVSNNELFQKTGAEFTLKWLWQTTPQSVHLHYAMLRGGEYAENVHENAIFNNALGSVVRSVESEDTISPDFGENLPYQAGRVNGMLRMYLYSDFGHAAYPKNLAEWTAVQPLVGNGPSLPFDPKMAEISIDYSVGLEESKTHIAPQIKTTEYYQIYPFGVRALGVGTGKKPFVPSLFPAYNKGADAGALYVGLEQWMPGTQLSLLIQVAEGTADPLLEKPEDHLSWDYLDENEWTPFANDELADGTDGFLRSGIVRMDLPVGVKAANSIFNDELQWLRISAVGNTDAVNYLLGLHVNGVTVVQSFTKGQTASAEPLPAGTIAKLLLPKPGVKKVHQPYPTFGGAGKEDRDGYFTRLSERLRHKDRGLMEWDVERLVLQAFPEVERVICLNHLEFRPLSTPGTHVYNELKAGHFTVLPLGRSGGDGLRPYVSLATREAIEDFLVARISCHATLHVRNPLFEEVLVTSDVRFNAGTDEAWALGKINEDLINYLSPWHNSGLGEIDFSAEVHRSAVVNFLEDLPYVDYVKNLVLRQVADSTQNEGERLHSTKLVSVLASARDHVFQPVKATAEVVLPEVCTTARRRRRAQLINETPEA